MFASHVFDVFVLLEVKESPWRQNDVIDLIGPGWPIKPELLLQLYSPYLHLDGITTCVTIQLIQHSNQSHYVQKKKRNQECRKIVHHDTS